MAEAFTIAYRALQEVSAMNLIESLAYVIGFFLIWGASVGIVWSVDHWIIKPILGRTLIREEFWR